MNKQLLQQALDALESFAYHGRSIRWDRVATDLHAALAQPAPEPVAWRIFDGEGGYDYRDEEPELFDVDWAARYGRKYEPLYATPQQAQPQSEPMLWVPPEREGEFHHDHSSVTGYRNRMAGWIPLYATPPAQPAPAVPADMVAVPRKTMKAAIDALSCWGVQTEYYVIADALRAALAAPAAPAVPPGELDDLQIDHIVENSEGRWVEDVFHVEGPALADMLRAAYSVACAAPAAPAVPK